jgi:hypothetical protein
MFQRLATFVIGVLTIALGGAAIGAMAVGNAYAIPDLCDGPAVTKQQAQAGVAGTVLGVRILTQEKLIDKLGLPPEVDRLAGSTFKKISEFAKGNAKCLKLTKHESMAYMLATVRTLVVIRDANLLVEYNKMFDSVFGKQSEGVIAAFSDFLKVFSSYLGIPPAESPSL